MKRSEANIIQAARNEMSREYRNFSVDDAESYFTLSGCEICRQVDCGGAGDIVDVTALAVTDTEAGNFDNPFEFQLCNGCLCSLVNTDDTDLDYYVTDEDVG